MKKYRNKYRTTTVRAQWWDYGWNGAYFVTLCTHNRQHFFGTIENGEMILSSPGSIAYNLWSLIPDHFEYAELGDFVIMPDHMHGILIIDKPDHAEQATEQDQNQLKTGGITGAKNPMINDNISRIIRWYKGRCSFEIKKILPHFAWQSRFHDHIIRNYNEYQRISDYIVNNPQKWEDAKSNSFKTKNS
ncbi:transposase [Flavobacterium sp.]|uniref:transposase n=1 Tax=Flavobacterium sp. TaxID=239 RepID=UPI003B9A66ED